jgi:Holliday junction resolvase RusA-like endonuclease
MKSLEIYITGEPKGQPRPRACIRGKRAGMYDPGTADSWKSCVRHAAKDALLSAGINPAGLTAPIFTGPLRVDIALWFPRPKAHFRKSGIKQDAPTYHTSKPDRDNCEKAILDALGANELQIWRDDAQVCSGGTSKNYAATDQAAGARIRITCLDT